MAIDALARPFLRLPLFQGLKPLQITEIVRRADRIVYKPGDVIIREDKAGDAAVLVVSGEALRVSGLESGAPAEPVAEGSLLGELAMLVETVHTTTVIAKSNVRALRISRESMREQMADDPALAAHMMEKIHARLRKLAAELKEIDQVLAGISAIEMPPVAGHAVHALH